MLTINLFQTIFFYFYFTVALELKKRNHISTFSVVLYLLCKPFDPRQRARTLFWWWLAWKVFILLDFLRHCRRISFHERDFVSTLFRLWRSSLSFSNLSSLLLFQTKYFRSYGYWLVRQIARLARADYIYRSKTTNIYTRHCANSGEFSVSQLKAFVRDG